MYILRKKPIWLHQNRGIHVLIKTSRRRKHYNFLYFRFSLLPFKYTYEYGKLHRKNLRNVESTDALLMITDKLNPKQSENITCKFINKYWLNSRDIIHMIEYYVKVANKSDLSAWCCLLPYSRENWHLLTIERCKQRYIFYWWFHTCYFIFVYSLTASLQFCSISCVYAFI